MHGFEITAWIEARAIGNLDIVDSALYQSLYRLEERRAISADWGVTEKNRRARYRNITPPGRAGCARPPGGTATPRRSRAF